MALFAADKVKISGLSACVPKKQESNLDYDHISESERELLIKTTGIKTRRIAEPGVTTSDLCFEAATKLISDLKWNKEEITLLIFISQSRDYFLPSTAIILQDRLDLPKSTVAFDISLGCSGFTYGLSITASMMKTTGIKKALLMVGDISSCSLSYEDKSTYPLFGDAGAVVALELSESDDKMIFSLNSDGSGHQAIIIPDGGLRFPVNNDTYKMVEEEKGIKRNRRNLWLNGLDVFAFSVKEVPLSIAELLNYSKLTVSDLDFFVMHQANLLMNETIRKKLKIEAEKVPYSLKDYGNTSSASIPLTMVTQLREQLSSGRKNLLLSGFGVGLSWGSVIVTTSDLVIPEIIEI